MDRQRKGLLALLFLSPAFGELVSGSSPPLEFFNPLSLLGLMALYGCGALLIRDAAIRWDKGWATILCLGLAYGVYEEGIVVKSWFDPGWMDLGILGTYGRVGGVNWVWGVWLTTYHAVISIALPIVLTNLLFPDFKGKRLLTDRATRYALFAFGFIFLPFDLVAVPYWGGPEHLIALISAVGFVAIARDLPKDLLHPRAATTPRRAWPFAALGFAWMASIVLIYTGLGPALLPYHAAIGFGLAVTAVALLFLERSLPARDGERFLFAFLVGALGLFLIFGFVLGIVKPAAFFGMPVVAALTSAFLFWLWRTRVPRSRERPDVGGPPSLARLA